MLSLKIRDRVQNHLLFAFEKKMKISFEAQFRNNDRARLHTKMLKSCKIAPRDLATLPWKKNPVAPFQKSA